MAAVSLPHAKLPARALSGSVGREVFGARMSQLFRFTQPWQLLTNLLYA